MTNILITLIDKKGDPTRVIPWGRVNMPVNGIAYDPDEHSHLLEALPDEDRAIFDAGKASVLHEKVKGERARRVEAGVTLSLPDYSGPIVLRGRDADREYLHGKMTAAGLMAQAGVTSPVVGFVDAANVQHTFTPAQFIKLWSDAMAWIDAVYSAGLALRKMAPIPDDFADDKWWPDGAGA